MKNRKITILALVALFMMSLAGGAVSASADVSRSGGESKSKGNSLFSSWYDVGADLSAKARANGKHFVELDATAEYGVEVLSKEKSIIKVTYDAWTRYRDKGEACLRTYVLGASVYSHCKDVNWGGGDSTESFGPSLNKNMTFFNKKKWFWVGPVPLRLKGKAKGYAGVDIDMSLSTLGATADFKPYAGLKATGSVTVGISGVLGFGVIGELKLLDLSFPLENRIGVIGDVVSWRLYGRRTVRMLSGKIKLFATIFKTWYKTVAQWNGIYNTETLYNLSNVETL